MLTYRRAESEDVSPLGRWSWTFLEVLRRQLIDFYKIDKTIV